MYSREQRASLYWLVLVTEVARSLPIPPSTSILRPSAAVFLPQAPTLILLPCAATSRPFTLQEPACFSPPSESKFPEGLGLRGAASPKKRWLGLNRNVFRHRVKTSMRVLGDNSLLFHTLASSVAVHATAQTKQFLRCQQRKCMWQRVYTVSVILLSSWLGECSVTPTQIGFSPSNGCTIFY